jgi:hypothetical protein
LTTAAVAESECSIEGASATEVLTGIEDAGPDLRPSGRRASTSAFIDQKDTTSL